MMSFRPPFAVAPVEGGYWMVPFTLFGKKP